MTSFPSLNNLLLGDVDETSAPTPTDEYQESTALNPEMFMAEPSYLNITAPDYSEPFLPGMSDGDLSYHPGQAVIIGCDCEYYQVGEGKDAYVVILSYQYYLIMPDGRFVQGIIYPKSRKKKDRLTLEEFIAHALSHAISDRLMVCYPTLIYVSTFFARADLTHFNQVFKSLKTYLQSSRRSIASLTSDDTYGIDVESIMNQHMNKAGIQVRKGFFAPAPTKVMFVDTMLIAPNGKSLDDIGKMLGIPKLTIPAPFSISEMQTYLKKDKKGFEAYAQRDAELAAVYLQWYRSFALGADLQHIPPTIGSMALSLFKRPYEGHHDQFEHDFGKRKVKREYWPKDDSKRQSPITKTDYIPYPSYADFEQLAINCYHGGYNICNYMGPTPQGEYNDFDIRSCYTTILLSIRPLNYENKIYTEDPEAYTGDKMGIALVDFIFPDDCLYPSLPVRSDNGLIYPLQGSSHCTLHEIELALKQGCDIKIRHGFIIPWVSERHIFKEFMQEVRDNRNTNGKGTLEERLWKEIGNSLYGKTAQGLRAKTGFELSKGLSKPMSPSAITNPYYAAYITGYARALLHEMVLSIPTERQVISVTTDGFLTDATLDEISLDGDLSQRFSEWHKIMDPEATCILEQKHGAQQIIAMKTRGQLTAIPHEEYDMEPVVAKAGVKVPREVKDQNAYMVDLYLNRRPGQMIDASHLISTRDQFLQEQDLITVFKEQRLSLEFDCKREMIDPQMIKVSGQSHIACQTRPFKTLAEQQHYRVLFDGWRKNHCMKTLEDYKEWNNYQIMKERHQSLSKVKNPGYTIQKDDTPSSLLVKFFCRGYMQGKWGFPPIGYRRPVKHDVLCTLFQEHGVKFTAASISSSRSKTLVEEGAPLTEETVALLKSLLELFPDFSYRELFAKDDRDELEQMLSAD